MRASALYLSGLMLVSSAASAQNEAPVTACDSYAASPFDQTRKAEAVSFDKINPAVAIPACEDAVRKYPDSARLIAQLGRAYSKSGNFEAAALQNQKAALKGSSVAQYNLGVAYEKGQGVSIDFKEAVKWYRKAADQGDASAQNNLGSMYQNGMGVPQNSSEALKWYRKAADKGYDNAENNIGTMYNFGQGVQIDYAEAEKWYRLAADKGNVIAQKNLKSLREMHQTAPTTPTTDAATNDNLDSAVRQARACVRANIGNAYAAGVYGDDQTNSFFIDRCYAPYALAVQQVNKSNPELATAYAGVAISSFKLLIVQEIRPDEWKEFQEKLKRAMNR
jgi:TPR repeat protein